MRKLKQISLAVAITLALSTGAMAGIIECPPAPEQSSASATGITDTPPSDQQLSLVTTVAITLVQIAISGR